MKKINLWLAIALIAIVFTGCADVQPIEECVTNNPSGFLMGLWHGLITLFSFIGSLFSDDIAIYDVNNTGGWYDFGFLLGVGGLGFGTSKAKR
jgi:hypothetical protein